MIVFIALCWLIGVVSVHGQTHRRSSLKPSTILCTDTCQLRMPLAWHMQRPLGLTHPQAQRKPHTRATALLQLSAHHACGQQGPDC